MMNTLRSLVGKPYSIETIRALRACGLWMLSRDDEPANIREWGGNEFGVDVILDNDIVADVKVEGV